MIQNPVTLFCHLLSLRQENAKVVLQRNLFRKRNHVQRRESFPPAPLRRIHHPALSDNDGNLLESEIQSSSTERTRSFRGAGREYRNRHVSKEITILESQGFDGFLDDELIRKVQELLQAQFPDFDGLQPTAVLLIPGYSTVEGKAVQIHYDEDRTHWITTCFKDGSILIADSLREIKPSSSICEQICNLYANVLQDPLDHIEYLDVDQQLDLYNCGVFSIANAFELMGIPPAMMAFSLLLFCIILTPSPETKRKDLS